MSSSEHFNDDVPFTEQDIVVLSSFEAVRKRPTFYIRSIGTDGIYELIAMLVELAIRPEHTPIGATKIRIALAQDGTIVVADNGRGLPVIIGKSGKSWVEGHCTSLLVPGKNPLAITNALSAWLHIQTATDDGLWSQKYEFVTPTAAGHITETSACIGTTISFLPDKKIFSDSSQLQIEPLIALLRQELQSVPQEMLSPTKHTQTSYEPPRPETCIEITSAYDKAFRSLTL